MDTLKYEIADRASSLQKYDFFLQNMQGQTSIEALVKDFLKTKPSVKVFDIGFSDFFRAFADLNGVIFSR